MLPRQDSRLSSSRRQTPPTEARDRQKSVGCMSGIFRLISKYQNRQKLLTFGRKVEKKAATITTKLVNAKVEDEEKISYPTVKEDSKRKSESLQNITVRRLSCDVDPRSPILSPKLRWPDGGNVTENGKIPQPAMELEKEESNEAKRQRLLEALEKCNEDLEALKMIIKAVQSDGKSVQPPRLLNSVEEEEHINNGGNESNEEVKIERWSTSSCSSYSKSHAIANVEQMSGESSKTTAEEDENNGICFFDKFVREPFRKKRRQICTTNWVSRAMVRSVEEVCNDVAWGQKREVTNIGLMLHNHICKDLIEETIKELGYHKMYGLPRHACKRRLSF